MSDWAGSGTDTTITSDNVSIVRLMIGDKTIPYFLSDAEISYFLDEANDIIILAAIMACDALIATFGLKVTKKIADQSVNYSDLQDHFIKLKGELQQRYNSGGYAIASPTSGDSEAISRFTSNQFDYV
jgi:hypothetical protein